MWTNKKNYLHNIYTLTAHYVYRYFMPPPREPSYNYGPSMLQKKSKEPFMNDTMNVFILRNSLMIILISFLHWRLHGWNLRKRVVSFSPGWGELELGLAWMIAGILGAWDSI